MFAASRPPIMLSLSSARLSTRRLIFCVCLPAVICALPLRSAGQQAKAPSRSMVSLETLSGYVIQGAANDERLQYLLEQPASSKEQVSKLRQALADQNAAWTSLLNAMKGWKPTPQDLQRQIPQRFVQLVSIARSSLVQSAGTIKKSTQYSWLASRLTSSLAKVDVLQARLKQVITPAPSETGKAGGRKQ